MLNPSHSRQEREQRAERHRARQLLKTEAGTRQWMREAQLELNRWLAGVADEVVAQAAAELYLPGLMQEAIARRDTPSALAARVWSLVHDRVKAAPTLRPPCAACSHHAGDHSTVVDAWCYECQRECRYV